MILLGGSLNGANEAAALEHVLPEAVRLQALGAFVARTFGWSTDQRPSVNYYGDVNTVVVCDEARRKQLIEQRQRMLEEESKGTVIEFNGDQADSQTTGRKTAAAVTALPVRETPYSANVGAMDGIVVENQSPTPKQDPLSQWRDSVGRAETWKTGKGDEPENQAGMFGPHPEEIY